MNPFQALSNLRQLLPVLTSLGSSPVPASIFPWLPHAVSICQASSPSPCKDSSALNLKNVYPDTLSFRDKDITNACAVPRGYGWPKTQQTTVKCFWNQYWETNSEMLQESPFHHQDRIHNLESPGNLRGSLSASSWLPGLPVGASIWSH